VRIRQDDAGIGEVEATPDNAVLGRERELALLRGFLDTSANGPASCYLVGEAGIGKTTLWQAAVADARGRTFEVLTSRPAGGELQLSFASLSDLFGAVLGKVEDELPAPRRSALRVALLLDEPEGAPPDPRAIGLAVLSVLQQLSLRSPVLVAIDDAQWLDRPTADALHFALRRLARERVALLVAARPDDSRWRERLAGTLPEGVRSELVLGHLSVATIQRLVGLRLGIALPRPLLVRVHEASDGNPFYALELARALQPADGELLPGAELPVPETLLELVGGRIASLPEEAFEIALAVASLSDRHVSVLRALGSERRVEDGLRAAVEAGVLVVDDQELVGFTHPLLASAVNAKAGPDGRKHMHRLLAPLEPEAEARSRHLALAADGPDAELATSLDRGARQAALRGAPAAAAELAELAAAATPPEARTDRLRRTLQAVDSYVAAGATEPATRILTSLLDEQTAGDARADVVLRLAGLSSSFDELLALAARAGRDATSEAMRARVHLVYTRGWPVFGIDRAVRHAEIALRLAETADDRRLLVDVLARLSLWRIWSSRNPFDYLERAIALERWSDGLRAYESPRMALALWRMYQGRHAEAHALLSELYSEATVSGYQVATLEVGGRLADVALRAGRWGDADAYAMEVYELSEQIGHENGVGLSVYWKALTDAHLGRVEEARETAELGARLARAGQADNVLVMSLGVLGFLDISVDKEADALPHLRPVLDWVADKQLGLVPHPTVPYALEALVAAGELDEARGLLERFAREARDLDTPWGLAIEARCRAQLVAAEGSPADAVAAAKEALVFHEHGRWPFEQARSLLVLGRNLRRMKRKSDAKDVLGTALTIFERLPAPLWAEQCRGEIARLGLRRAPTGELTEGERRVAELAASGLTNREVAARLFMSPKTVEANLARAYRKLGIHSRAELGSRMGPG
jgi:DNA-binding CsgD family transcriptional regulator